jgi:hypothetical protein
MQQTNESDDRLRGIDTKTVSVRGLRSFFSVLRAKTNTNSAGRNEKMSVLLSGIICFLYEKKRECDTSFLTFCFLSQKKGQH